MTAPILHAMDGRPLSLYERKVAAEISEHFYERPAGQLWERLAERPDS